MLAAILVLGWCGEGLWIAVTGDTTSFEEWRQHNAGFKTLILFVGPVLAAGIATALFLFWWYRWTKRRYLAKARKKPNELVLTAGPNNAEIVGREEVAQVIAQRLRNRSTRRPYLLVGGVGVGKTAVLVRLTEMLARQHAVPVPIRLRDAAGESDLNFEQMAKQRFSEEAPQGILARSKNERVWQQLLADDKPVVIADGLEEALLDEKLQDDRDNIIRRAIERAYQEKLPLVIASRPHTSLEGTRAAIIDLEPLSEESALKFVEANAPEADERRLDWIVETAEVAESLIYLQIARELQDQGILEPDRPRQNPQRLNTRSKDCSTLRLLLLDTWYEALVEGRLRDDIPLASQDRRDTLEVVSALACVGLLQDTLEVSFGDLLGKGVHPGLPRTKRERLWTENRGSDKYCKRGSTFSAWHRELIWSTLCDRLSDEEGQRLCRGSIDQCHTALARLAHNADVLQLVEGFQKKVRFPHSIIQAYLGFRMLNQLGDHGAGELIKAGELIEQALYPPGPSRELLIALVLLSRQQTAESTASGGSITSEAQKYPHEQSPLSGKTLAQRLYVAAGQHTDPKAFDLYAAALEIEGTEDSPRLLYTITDKLQVRWPSIKGDKRTLDAAKLRLVKQLGAALRAAAGKTDTTPLYERLFKLGKGEPSYSIRLAAAQEFGNGGDSAFAVIRRWIDINEDPVEEYARRKKVDERVSLWREFVMRAWMIPMLLGSVGDGHRSEARQRLMQWLRHLDPEQSAGTPDLPISLENALAKGFKFAANRRKRHPHTYEGGRADLIWHAETMLQQTRCWYSQLSLLHALCLWELPDSIAHDEQRCDAAASQRDGRHDALEPSEGYRGTTAVQTVERWLSMAGTAHASASQAAGDGAAPQLPLHPFIAEAGDLVALALETGRPEGFIWIDEQGVVDNIGSRTSGPRQYRKHNLWIPPSVGWSTLDGRAQHLIADVMVMLTLIERDGRQPDEVDARLNRSAQPIMPLPPCITTDRTALHPELTDGTSAPPTPGTTCLPTSKFKLCPYPPHGTHLLRAEIREPFCRQQQALLPGPVRRRFPRVFRRKTPHWVGMRVRELDQFWEAMADRMRSKA
ncbi:ATP-binding protein [Streptomyces gilvosporeus]